MADGVDLDIKGTINVKGTVTVGKDGSFSLTGTMTCGFFSTVSGSVLKLTGVLTVTGSFNGAGANLTIGGGSLSVGSLLLGNATVLTIPSSSVALVSSSGNVTFAGQLVYQITLALWNQILAGGVVVSRDAEGNLVRQIGTFPTAPPKPATAPAGSASVSIVNFGSSTGTFDSVSVLAPSGTSACTTPLFTPTYGASALSATVSVSNTCGGLSTGAIVGIAIGRVLEFFFVAFSHFFLFSRSISWRTCCCCSDCYSSLESKPREGRTVQVSTSRAP